MVDYATLFSWSNSLAMLGWVLLMFSPKRWTWLLATTGVAIPMIMGTLYGALMLANFAGAEGAGYGSLTQVRAFMNYDPTLLAGWLHYLCFDLVVATYIAIEADKIGIVRIVQIPILLATFLFGPVGFVLFLVTKGCWQMLSHWRLKGAV